MEHLPNTHDPLPSPLQVPFLTRGPGSDYRYDYKGFAGYPERNGWTEKALLGGPLPAGLTAADRAAFLQSWLYFAFMAEFLSLRESSFGGGGRTLEGVFRVKNDKGELVLSTHQLGKLLLKFQKDHWEGIIRIQDLAKRTKGGEHLLIGFKEELLEITDAQLQAGFERIRVLRTLGPKAGLLPEAVVFSIIMLGESLLNVRNLIFIAIGKDGNPLSGQLDSDGRPEGNLGEITGGSWSEGDNRILEDCLRESSWCPSEIWYLNQRLSVSFMAYVTRLRRYRPLSRHERCTDFVCLDNQLTGAYETAHAYGCDRKKCMLLSANIEKVKEVLKKGQIPTITVSKQLDSNVYKVEVHAGILGRRYAAISHVWSQGLGNPKLNALFSCQLSRLQSYVDELPKDSGNKEHLPFWIDSLCVPVHEADIKYRKLAITLMHKTYSEAADVLAIDAEWSTVPSSAPTVELLTRISFSSWMRRLWTLQEATLARTLWFRFADRSVSEKALHDVMFSVEVIYSPVVRDAGLAFQKIRHIPRAVGVARLFSIIEALRWRSTSKSEDEPICFATLLQVDVSPLLNLETPSRMKEIWSSQKRVPRSLLLSRGPHLSEPGFSWAPASLLGKDISMGSVDDTLVQNRSGLLLTCPGWRFQRHSLPFDLTQPRFVTKDLETQEFYILETLSSLKHNPNLDQEGLLLLDVFPKRRFNQLQVELGETEVSSTILVRMIPGPMEPGDNRKRVCYLAYTIMARMVNFSKDGPGVKPIQKFQETAGAFVIV